jgi:hypothetical protein
MSFLVNRFYNWVDNSTRDPVAEKRAKQESDAKYELSRNYKKIQIDDNERLLSQQDKYSSFDLDIIKSLLKERQTLIDDTTGLSADEYKTKWIELTDKYNIVANPKSNVRSQLWSQLIIRKQLLRDLNDSKPELSSVLKADIKEILKFLNDNIYTESTTIFQNYRNILDSKLGASQSDNDVATLLKSVLRKLEKNKMQLDFQEEGGPPVPDHIKSETEKLKAAEADKINDTFDAGRLFTKILGYAISVFTVLFILFLLAIGSSFAVNLNIYKPVPFRVLYAIYGLLFSFIVIPYTLLYRWVYLGRPPKYYGFIPLIPRFFIHRPVQFLLGWLTYKPDASMWDLEEWRHHHASA